MVQYYEELKAMQAGLKGVTNIPIDRLTDALTAYRAFIERIAQNAPTLHAACARHSADIDRAMNNIAAGMTEMAFLTLMISMGSLSAFLINANSIDVPRTRPADKDAGEL